MNLDESQKAQVAAWIGEGLKLADIQKRLGAELGVHLTYMEVRLLVDDLKLMPKDAEPPTAPGAALKPPAAAPDRPAARSSDVAEASPTTPAGAGGVTVTLDQVMRPGAVASGQVTFSDGKSAGWYLDQLGRLGFVPKEKGYRPSPADVEEFQMALQSELARAGF